MLIEIHMIQNHAPANLNRDDLGAPKTCWFGGVLRSRISSQCLKRSIRFSNQFATLRAGVRTRRLAHLIAAEATGKEEGKEYDDAFKRAENILEECGFKARKKTKAEADDEEAAGRAGVSKMLIYTTFDAIREMADLLKNAKKNKADVAAAFAEIIANRTAVPDMALTGRMLEPSGGQDYWKGTNTTVEAALQVAHAFSTHEARPEVDYYVTADDVKRESDDAGAGYVDEAMFTSACFYKYFSLNWDQLTKNLQGFNGKYRELAAHTLGALLLAAAENTPTGKQNSYAAHNPPDGILVEVKDNHTPISYANAFAAPVVVGPRDLISQSVAQLAQYVLDLDVAYGPPRTRFWFSPNDRYPLLAVRDKKEVPLVEGKNVFPSLDELVKRVVQEVGFDWDQVQKVIATTAVQ